MYHRDDKHPTWRYTALALTVLSVLVFPASAGADVLWAITGSRDLWTIDVSTGSQILVGTTNVTFFEIAMSPAGLLMGVTSQGDLYRIDTASAAVELVGSFGLGDPGGWNAMDFDPSGTLYVARERLLIVDPQNANATVVGETGFSASGDLTVAPDGALYMSATSGTGIDDLVRIDPVTGQGVLVGSIGYSRVFGLAFVGDTLYGATSSTHLITIDTESGAGELAGNIVGSVLGMSSAPAIVPEPGDANRDGSVDVIDLGILATNYDQGGGFGWGDADFTGDGFVDVADLGILATNYGYSTSVASIPEPSTFVLASFGLLGLVMCSRRRKR